MLLFLRCCYLAFLPLCAVIILLHSSFLGKRIWTIMLCQRLSPDMPLQLASDTILRMLRARVHHHRQGQVSIILFLIFRWNPLRNHLVWLWPILTDFLSGYKLCDTSYQFSFFAFAILLRVLDCSQFIACDKPRCTADKIGGEIKACAANWREHLRLLSSSPRHQAICDVPWWLGRLLQGMSIYCLRCFDSNSFAWGVSAFCATWFCSAIGTSKVIPRQGAVGAWGKMLYLSRAGLSVDRER